MVMAGDKNRDRDKHQGGDQTTSPPAFFPFHLLFEPIKAPVNVVVVSFSSSAGFFRHESRSP
ncbi:MAG TPA: hypothetical protein VGH29_11580 [Candidatus Binataceae bacterium]